MKGQFARFHLQLSKRGKEYRTTVSLDTYLANLLASSLNEKPGTREAHSAVRHWLDKALADWAAFDPELPVSRQAAYLALRRIAKPELVQKLGEG